MNSAYFQQAAVLCRELRSPLRRAFLAASLCAALLALAYIQQLQGEAMQQEQEAAMHALRQQIEARSVQRDHLLASSALAQRLEPGLPRMRTPSLLRHLLTRWPAPLPAESISAIQLSKPQPVAGFPAGWHEESLQITVAPQHAEQVLDFATALLEPNGGLGLLRACTLRRQAAADETAPDTLQAQCQLAWLNFHGQENP